MKFFEKEIWRQTTAALISLFSFVFLYFGGVNNSKILIYTGIIVFGISVLGPVILKIYQEKGDNHE